MVNYKILYTLGLDIGIASVGWAVLVKDKIIDLGVRAFDKAETPKGESLNMIRRENRSTRRRLRRKSYRLQRILDLFKKEGLISKAKPSEINTVANEESPWLIRCKGLNRKLENKEWAKALYHIAKRRGFKSNSKRETLADEKAGQMLSGVNENRSFLASGQYRTVAEMIVFDAKFANSKRNKGGVYTHTIARSDLEEEVHKLFAAQRNFNNQFASEELEAKFIEIFTYQKPPLTGEAMLDMIGKCTFEKDEYRAPKCSYTAERFIWLSKLNNLTIIDNGSRRHLTDAERDIIKDMPYKLASVNYSQIRNELDKKIGFNPDIKFTGLRYSSAENAKDPEKTKLIELKGYHSLRKAYNKCSLDDLWNKRSVDIQKLDDIAYALSVLKTDEELEQFLFDRNFSADEIKGIETVTMDGFVNLSIKALQKINPHLENYLRYDQAIRKEYNLNQQIGMRKKYLPKIDYNDIRNPVVAKTLNQSRKVINAIIKKYGSPENIHIEMARDLSKPFSERKRIEKEQQNYRNEKNKNLEDFEQLFGYHPSSKNQDLLKWRLYRQQDSKCAYSLKPIDIDRLSEIGYVEIDHILPYSRSYDDSLNNKVLVLKAENQNKGNRTPYEYMSGANNSEKWRLFEEYVKANKKFREAKKQRLLRKHFEGDDAESFKSRNINDTRYISRFLKNWVEEYLLFADETGSNRCVVINGSLTAFLRTRWGLLKVREASDKHHALDAAVIAACNRSIVKRLSDYSRRGEVINVATSYVDPETGELLDIAAVRKLQESFPVPWDGFRDELEIKLSDDPKQGADKLKHLTEEERENLNPIRVSRAPKRLNIGAAHQETIRSAKLLEEQKSTIKTKLTSIKLKDLPKMVGYDDPRNIPLIKAITERLKQFDGNGEKAFANFELRMPNSKGEVSENSSIIRSIKLADTQKSGIPVRGGIANNGDMVRIDIFSKDKKYFVVPLYVHHIVNNDLPNMAVAANKPESEWLKIDDSFAFEFSLYPNDYISVKFSKKDDIEGYYAGFDRFTGAIHIWAHDRAKDKGKDGLYRGIGIRSASELIKFNVDVLGNLYRSPKEQRNELAQHIHK